MNALPNINLQGQVGDAASKIAMPLPIDKTKQGQAPNMVSFALIVKFIRSSSC